MKKKCRPFWNTHNYNKWKPYLLESARLYSDGVIRNQLPDLRQRRQCKECGFMEDVMVTINVSKEEYKNIVFEGENNED